MRKVFLDGLPRLKSGRNEGRIDWNGSIGYIIKFIYDEFKGSIEIVNYNKEKTKDNNIL